MIGNELPQSSVNSQRHNNNIENSSRMVENNNKKRVQSKSFVGTGTGADVSHTAPFDVFVSNTSKNTTVDDVKQQILAQTTDCGNPVHVLNVKSMNKSDDVNLRTRSWCVSFPFDKKAVMLKSESWPSGWYYRKFTHYRTNNQINGSTTRS